jgi:hypothetical protein
MVLDGLAGASFGCDDTHLACLRGEQELALYLNMRFQIELILNYRCKTFGTKSMLFECCNP